MKTISVILIQLLVGCLLTTQTVYGQGNSKYETLNIKTSAQCGMCKDLIERTLAFEKGVKSSDLSMDTKDVEVKYNPQKTTPDKIRQAISKVGYDADAVAADSVAYSKLPPCCKKPDDPGHTDH